MIISINDEKVADNIQNAILIETTWRKIKFSKNRNIESFLGLKVLWQKKKKTKSSSLVQSTKLFVTHGLKHVRYPCPSPTPRVYSYSCPLSLWCHPTVSSSVFPFSSRLQSFPASGSFQMNQFFTSGGQSFGVSASASVLPINIQVWFPFGWTGLISLQSKGLSRIFSNATVQKHQFFNWLN